MAVTANQTIHRAEGKRRSFPVAASTTIYEGTLVYINASGYADDDTASGVNKFAGIAVAEVDNSAGSNGDLNVEVYCEGDFRLVGSGFAQTSVGLDAFGTDNFTIDDADGASAVRIGTVVGYTSSTVLTVAIEPEGYSQQAALTAQSTSITHTAPGTPDFAIQDLINTNAYGFVTKDEGNTVLQVIVNLQTRVAELETKLKAVGLLA